MATSKLYPTLSKFYEGKHIDYGSELDVILSYPSNHKRNRKDSKHDRASKTSSSTNNEAKSQHVYSRSTKTEAHSLYPKLSENYSEQSVIQQASPHKHELRESQQSVPSAPPVNLMDDELLRFFTDALEDQSFKSPLDETPAVDYSMLTLPSDDTWTDDLLPDYDVTSEEIEPDFLNNLDKTDFKTAKDKLIGLEVKTDLSVNLNITPEVKSSHIPKSNHTRKHRNAPGKTELPDAQSSNRSDEFQVRKVLEQQRSKRTTPTGAGAIARPSPESPEYNAWMTWRKQVNRQLATAILLRQGVDVKLNRNDLSRKHLNQKSIDFVSNVVKPGNKTSLGGKPFLMYGIPRVSLSGGQGS